MLDKKKVSPDLWVRILWSPDPGRTEPPIVFAFDRTRWLIGGVFMVAAFVCIVAGLVTNTAWWLGAIALLVSFGAYEWVRGGRSGYYEVADDGSLGDYLGRRKPETSWMRLTRIR